MTMLSEGMTIPKCDQAAWHVIRTKIAVKNTILDFFIFSPPLFLGNKKAT
jgi:hypothetical protein